MVQTIFLKLLFYINIIINIIFHIINLEQVKQSLEIHLDDAIRLAAKYYVRITEKQGWEQGAQGQVWQEACAARVRAGAPLSLECLGL